MAGVVMDGSRNNHKIMQNSVNICLLKFGYADNDAEICDR